MRAAAALNYLTCHVVEVVGAACRILEEGGIRFHVTIQQAIKNLKSDETVQSVLSLFSLLTSDSTGRDSKPRGITMNKPDTQYTGHHHEEAPSICYLKSLHPLLLLDEFNPKVCLLDHVLSLKFIDHACLVHEIAITTQHLKRGGEKNKSQLWCWRECAAGYEEHLTGWSRRRVGTSPL